MIQRLGRRSTVPVSIPILFRHQIDQTAVAPSMANHITNLKYSLFFTVSDFVLIPGNYYWLYGLSEILNLKS